MSDAPAAPAAAPAAAPPADTPQSPTVQAPFNDAFSDLDKMVGEGDTTPPGSGDGQSPPSDAVGAAGKPPPSTTSEPAQPAKPASDKPASTPKTGGENLEPPIEKMPPKQLREAYTTLKAKLAEIQKQRDEYQAQLAKPKEDPEKKTLIEKLALQAKQLQEVEEERRLTRYEKSEEYKTKWYQPFIDAYAEGREAAAAIKVNGEDGAVRPGTPEDWDRYMRIQDEDAAADFADQVFGGKKGMMEYHRMQVLQKNKARIKAIEENKKVAADMEKQHGELREKANGEIAKLWTDSNEMAVKKYPHWFAPVEGDEKGNELLSRGMHLADRAFSSGQPLADGDKPLTPQQKVALDSAVRNKAGAFDRLAFQHAQAQKKIKTLEAKIAEYEKSEPGLGEGKRGETVEPGGWEADLERRAKPRG